MNFNIDLDRWPVLDIAASLALILMLLVLRSIARHAIRSRTEAAPHLQRRWSAGVGNLLFFLALIGIVLIWAPQLQTFALSLTAVAVAVVVATKELILCLSGSILRTSSRAFSVGDWIEVAGIRGEVIDHTVFVTKLHEFENSPNSFDYTGRTAIVPNSAFFGSPVRNQTYLRDHAYCSFSLTVEPDIDVFGNRTMIEETIDKHYAPYRDEALRVNAKIKNRTGIDLPDAVPEVRFGTTDIGKYRISISLFCPTRLARTLESKITFDLMSALHAMSRAPAADGKDHA